jgi:hypothetical protein
MTALVVWETIRLRGYSELRIGRATYLLARLLAFICVVLAEMLLHVSRRRLVFCLPRHSGDTVNVLQPQATSEVPRAKLLE